MEKLSLQKIKDLKKLRLKKYRDQQGLLYLEGETLIKDLILEFPALIHTLVLTEDKVDDFAHQDLPMLVGSEKDLEKLTQQRTPKKINAVVHYPSQKEFDPQQSALLLDQIQDPGNLGTIIRTADWFGINQIICAPQTTDFLNPKVIHASMASVFRVNVIYQDLQAIIAQNPKQTYGAYMDGKNFQTIPSEEIQFLVMGNEGHGISTEISKVISNRIGIPQKGQAESLNVAVATGILLQHMSKSNKD